MRGVVKRSWQSAKPRRRNFRFASKTRKPDRELFQAFRRSVWPQGPSPEFGYFLTSLCFDLRILGRRKGRPNRSLNLLLAFNTGTV